MLYLFYSKWSTDREKLPWSVWDEKKRVLTRATKVEIACASETVEKCKIPQCTGYVILIRDGKILNLENGKIRIVKEDHHAQ